MSIPELKVRIRTAIETITADMLQIFISVINQLDTQNFCFTISLFHDSTCFEHIVLIFVESQRVHTQSTCKVCNENLECCSIK